jgi:hypothetical protein
MIARDRRPYAVRSGALLPWSFAGYGPPEPLAPEAVVDVLTPPSTVPALKTGYRPLCRRRLSRVDSSPVACPAPQQKWFSR